MNLVFLDIVLQVVRGGKAGYTVSCSEDVPGPDQRAATPELEISQTEDTVADIDQPGVLAQLRLDAVHDPALPHQ